MAFPCSPHARRVPTQGLLPSRHYYACDRYVTSSSTYRFSVQLHIPETLLLLLLTSEGGCSSDASDFSDFDRSFAGFFSEGAALTVQIHVREEMHTAVIPNSRSVAMRPANHDVGLSKRQTHDSRSQTHVSSFRTSSQAARKNHRRFLSHSSLPKTVHFQRKQSFR